ncbi:uncharacterized protein [Littorina saxatilis]|uniref:Uncharacterized protein n=1 Tax=Littorina saxatilis TaxID=31220 RepID=A0AAN9BYR4_9CAEN
MERGKRRQENTIAGQEGIKQQRRECQVENQQPDVEECQDFTQDFTENSFCDVSFSSTASLKFGDLSLPACYNPVKEETCSESCETDSASSHRIAEYEAENADLITQIKVPGLSRSIRKDLKKKRKLIKTKILLEKKRVMQKRVMVMQNGVTPSGDLTPVCKSNDNRRLTEYYLKKAEILLQLGLVEGQIRKLEENESVESNEWIKSGLRVLSKEKRKQDHKLKQLNEALNKWLNKKAAKVGCPGGDPFAVLSSVSQVVAAWRDRTQRQLCQARENVQSLGLEALFADGQSNTEHTQKDSAQISQMCGEQKAGCSLETHSPQEVIITSLEEAEPEKCQNSATASLAKTHLTPKAHKQGRQLDNEDEKQRHEDKLMCHIDEFVTENQITPLVNQSYFLVARLAHVLLTHHRQVKKPPCSVGEDNRQINKPTAYQAVQQHTGESPGVRSLQNTLSGTLQQKEARTGITDVMRNPKTAACCRLIAHIALETTPQKCSKKKRKRHAQGLLQD